MYAQTVTEGVKTTDVAARQGLTARRALDVMRFAENEGWVHSVKAPHRTNAFYFRWVVFTRDHFQLYNTVSVEEKEIAKALVEAYRWGKYA